MSEPLKMSLPEFVEKFCDFKVQPWQRQILEEFEKHPNERLEMVFTRGRGHLSATSHYRWVPK